LFAIVLIVIFLILLGFINFYIEPLLPNVYKGKSVYFLLFTFVIVIILFLLDREYKSQIDSKSYTKSENCIGNQDCISKVRINFSNSGKTILGEEYLGNGKFGISFIDSEHPNAYNATLETDCNCEIIGNNVSRIR